MKKKKKYVLTAKEKAVDTWFEIPMLVVTIVLIVTLAIPLLFDLPPAWRTFFATANLFIWMTFYIELFVKLFTADNKKEILKRNWLLCVIALAPIFTPFRFVRISNIIRVFRLQMHVPKLKKNVTEFIYNIEYILIALAAFVGASGFMIWQVETRYDGSILSLSDGLWWAVITITTIGYGDIIPSSPQGRVVGAVIGLIGAVLFMTFVARITTLLIQNKRKS